jgi:RimJ/RimL family protein N-acetyltransferase
MGERRATSGKATAWNVSITLRYDFQMQPFPTPILTERLILRAPKPTDALELNAAVLETFEQLQRWMPWAQTPPSLADSVEVCTRMADRWQEMTDFPLFGFHSETGHFVLGSGCHRFNREVPSMEIGYWCRRSEQGKGFVQEAVHAITSAGFEWGMRRIEIRCDSDNDKSRAVAERCGFALEAELKNARRNMRGELGNTLIFVKTRDD